MTTKSRSSLRTSLEMDSNKAVRRDSKLASDEYDFCVNCNTVLFEETLKMSQINRIISTQLLSPTTTVHTSLQDGDCTTVTSKVSILTVISLIFNIHDKWDDLTSDKFFACEKCGQLLETAYNAIEDFKELTRRGSVLEGIIKTCKKFTESASSTGPPSKKIAQGNELLFKKKHDPKRSQRLMQNAKKVGDEKSSSEVADDRVQKSHCTLCGKFVASKALLMKHRRLFHKNYVKNDNQQHSKTSVKMSPSKAKLEEVKPEDCSEFTDATTTTDMPIYYCSICDMDFEKLDIFQNHEKLHEDNGEDVENTTDTDNRCHGNMDENADNDDMADYKDELPMEKFKCKFCGEGSNSFGDLKEHYLKHHPLVSILTVNDMHNIEGNKTGKKEEPDNDNEEEFEEKNKCLSQKTTPINGRLIFNCNVCNKQFIRHDHIKLHLRIHTKEKPFVCKVDGCAKTFSDPRGLAYHEVTHSNERPYCCKFCGMTFKRLHHLNDHERNHNEVPRRFICQFCEKAFKHRKHLNSHLVIHRGTKEYQCSLCFKAFNRKDNLGQHVKKVHGKDSTENVGKDNKAIPLNKETSQIGNGGKDVLKLVEDDGTPPTSSMHTVLFHSSNGTITTGTIITGSNNNNASSNAIIGSTNPTSMSSSTIGMTAAVKGPINHPATATTTAIPVAIAITDQASIDQIVYMHL